MTMSRSRRWPAAFAVAAFAFATAASANIDLTPSADPNPDADVAVQALKDGRWQVAVDNFNAALKAEPANAEFHNGLGYAYRRLGRLDPSFRHYREALRIDPKLKGAHEYIGEAYLASGDKAKAREHLAILEKLCGNKTCVEYRDLEASIAKVK